MSAKQLFWSLPVQKTLHQQFLENTYLLLSLNIAILDMPKLVLTLTVPWFLFVIVVVKCENCDIKSTVALEPFFNQPDLLLKYQHSNSEHIVFIETSGFLTFL